MIRLIALLTEHLLIYREETSNNRVRSGPQRQKAPRPIDTVPAAGARQGLPNGIETTEAGLAVADLEDSDRSPGIHPVHVRDSLSTIRTGNTLSVDTERLSYSQGGLLMSPGSSGSHTPTSGTATPGFASVSLRQNNTHTMLMVTSKRGIDSS